MLGSVAATADVQYNAAVQKHADCTYAITVSVATKNDPAYVLAHEALRGCQMEQAELAKLVTPEALEAILYEALYLRIQTIREVREGPRAMPGCAACGMRPTWNDKLKIWQAYPRNP